MTSDTDTLVYKLEDKDYNVRILSMQELGTIARNAKNKNAFLICNLQRFSFCIRRQLILENEEIMILTCIQLIFDVIPLLCNDLHRFASAILPCCVKLLTTESEKQQQREAVYLMFVQYAKAAQNFVSVLEIILNVGFTYVKDPKVREGSVQAAIRFVIELTENQCGFHDKLVEGLGDSTWFIIFLQSLIILLEDEDESVVVAAEYAIAALEKGNFPHPQEDRYLMHEDILTLEKHRKHIQEFAHALKAAHFDSSASVTRYIRGKRFELDSEISSPAIVYGFIPRSVYQSLERSIGHSHMEWISRSRATAELVEHSQKLIDKALQPFRNDMMPLFTILVSLLQDVDIDIIRSSIVVAIVLFRCLHSCQVLIESRERNGRQCMNMYLIQYLPELIDAIGLNASKHVKFECFAYKILAELFTFYPVKIIFTAISASFRHRRWRVREQALKIYILTLLICAEKQETDCQSLIQSSLSVSSLVTLLSDVNLRVQRAALYVATISCDVANQDIVSLLGAQGNEDKILEHIDFDALKQFVQCSDHLPRIQSDGSLLLPADPSAKELNHSARKSRELRRSSLQQLNTKDAMGHSKNSHDPVEPSLRKQVNSSCLELPHCSSTTHLTETYASRRPSQEQSAAFRPEQLDSLKRKQENKRLLIHAKSAQEARVRLKEDMFDEDSSPFGDPTNGFNFGCGEDRPIRPSHLIASEDNLEEIESNREAKVSAKVTKTAKIATPLSLATRKRLEAKRLEKVIAESPNARPVEQSDGARVHSASNLTNYSTHIDTSKESKLRKPSAGKKMKAIKAENADRPSAFDKNEPRYVETSELLPLHNPKEKLHKLLGHLQSEDWQLNFEALTDVRRLAMHHPQILSDQLHAIMKETLNQVRNLRSAVSKNALLAIETLATFLGKVIDSELDQIITQVLKRCADSNVFVSESASNTLSSLIRNCSSGKTVNAIALHVTSKAVPIRRQVARGMHQIVSILWDRLASREVDRVMNAIGKSLEDTNNEIRDIAKQSILYLFMERQMQVSALKKYIDPISHTKIDQLLATKHKNVASTPPSDREKKKVSSRPSTERRLKVSRGNSSGSLDVIALESMQTRMGSNNWKDRLDVILEMQEFIIRHARSLGQNGKIISIIDSMVNRINDGNNKVSIAAMESLELIIQAFGSYMEPALGMLLPVVIKNLSSNHNRMVQLSCAALEALLQSGIDQKLICQQLTAIAKAVPSRAKTYLLELLGNLVRQCEEKNYTTLTRYVVPLSLDLLREAKLEVKEANASLILALYETLGSQMLPFVNKSSEVQRDKLEAILGVRF